MTTSPCSGSVVPRDSSSVALSCQRPRRFTADADVGKHTERLSSMLTGVSPDLDRGHHQYRGEQRKEYSAGHDPEQQPAELPASLMSAPKSITSVGIRNSP